MEDGMIREVGRHEELMERRGFYFEMVERQRQSFGEVVSGLPIEPVAP
jgi:ABC-type transport system involved in cytochrome bd biosynthesis fused ATPase/permease subunit